MPILSEDAPEPARRGRVLTAVVAALLLASAAGSWLWLRRAKAPPPAAGAARPAVVKARPATEPAAEVLRDEHAAGARPRAKAEPRPAPLETVLHVQADVPGASVFLDRKFLGTAPVETRDVVAGPHRINVSADGYEMYAETIEIGPGRREVEVRFKEVRLDEELPVVHKHALGSCRGTLRATTAGLRFDATPPKDSWNAPFGALEALQLDYLRKNLRVKETGGRTYNFSSDSADALLAFQRAVEAARKRL